MDMRNSCDMSRCIVIARGNKGLITNTLVWIKVKQSRYRPGVAQRVPGSLRFPNF